VEICIIIEGKHMPLAAEVASLVDNNTLLRKHPSIQGFARVVHYKRKEIICKEGTKGNHVYILLSGTAMACRTSENGQQRILHFFKTNDIYGHIMLHDDFVHTMTIEVLEPSVILEINKTHFRQLVLHEPELMWYLYKDVAKKLFYTTQVIEDNFLPAEKRIIKSVLNLCRQFGHKMSEGTELRINVTQDILARYAGTTRVTAAKLICSLADRGVLRTRPKPWIVHRVDALMSYLSSRPEDMEDLL
jgi:CRP/FNR family transcriptional regulator, cyclic AMP receptor protein